MKPNGQLVLMTNEICGKWNLPSTRLKIVKNDGFKGGWYNWSKRTIFLCEWNNNLTLSNQKRVLLHELAHVMQYRYTKSHFANSSNDVPGWVDWAHGPEWQQALRLLGVRDKIVKANWPGEIATWLYNPTIHSAAKVRGVVGYGTDLKWLV